MSGKSTTPRQAFPCACGKTFPAKRSLAVHSMWCKLCTSEVRFWASVEKGDSCWMWTGAVNSDGYGHFRKDGRATEVYAHRFSYELHNAPIPPGMSVMHVCDKPRCVRPEHLKLGSHAENMKDMERKGRSTHGSKNWMAKLTEQAVLEIRRDYRVSPNGLKSNVRELAARYGVSRTAINNVTSGRKWGHVK